MSVAVVVVVTIGDTVDGMTLAVGVSTLGVALPTAIPLGVGVGPAPPRSTAAAMPATSSTASAPKPTAIMRPRSLPSDAADAVVPAAAPAPAPAAVGAVKRSPHWMQKLRPGGLRLEQFQQMTSGARPANDVGPAWGGVG